MMNKTFSFFKRLIFTTVFIASITLPLFYSYAAEEKSYYRLCSYYLNHVTNMKRYELRGVYHVDGECTFGQITDCLCVSNPNEYPISELGKAFDLEWRDSKGNPISQVKLQKNKHDVPLEIVQVKDMAKLDTKNFCKEEESKLGDKDKKISLVDGKAILTVGKIKPSSGDKVDKQNTKNKGVKRLNDLFGTDLSTTQLRLVIGSIVLISIGSVGVFFYKRKKRREKAMQVAKEKAARKKNKLMEFWQRLTS